MGLAGPTPRLDVTAPRARGVHQPYAAVPDRVRAWVDDTLGSPVVGTAEQIGGMSPGCATRLTLADGRRAFVKAVGPELNAFTPSLFRHEVEVLRHLGDDPLWAPLIDGYDETDGWAAVLLGDVEGRHPDMADLTPGGDARSVLEAVDRFTDRLAGCGRPDLGTLPEALGRFEQMWPHLPGLDLLPAWVPGVLPWLRARTADLGAAAAGSHLANYDIRNDNLLLPPSGGVVFVDWGMARCGAGWLDPLVVRLEWAELPVFDVLVHESAALRELGDELVTTFVLTWGCWLAYRAGADSTGPPGITAFRRQESARFLACAARRLGH